MYQFSRSLYRELAQDVVSGRGEDVCSTRLQFLRACESSMERLALDRHYFAKPVRTLFNDVRRLPAGHTLHWRDGRITISRYWDLFDDATASPIAWSPWRAAPGSMQTLQDPSAAMVINVAALGGLVDALVPFVRQMLAGRLTS